MLPEKHYLDWNKVKADIHNGALGHNRGLSYKPGRVYWVSIGENIGFEEDGKGTLFARPVLVLRGYGKNIFFGVPLTSKLKSGPYYYRFKIKGASTYSTAILNQHKTYDVARISSKKPIGSVDPATLHAIKQLIKKNLG